jgi:hypothetical protein
MNMTNPTREGGMPRRGVAVAVIVILASLIVLGLTSSFLVDWAWFSAVGYFGGPQARNDVPLGWAWGQKCPADETYPNCVNGLPYLRDKDSLPTDSVQFALTETRSSILDTTEPIPESVHQRIIAQDVE